jgi:hypothetical protein
MGYATTVYIISYEDEISVKTYSNKYIVQPFSLQNIVKEKGLTWLKKQNQKTKLCCSELQSSWVYFHLEQILQPILYWFSSHSPESPWTFSSYPIGNSERTPIHPTNYTTESWSCFVLKAMWFSNIVIAFFKE